MKVKKLKKYIYDDVVSTVDTNKISIKEPEFYIIDDNFGGDYVEWR